MVEKKEGATMTCRNCDTELVCREKHYPASEKYPEKTVLQWQNQDGKAHYSTKNGKDFTCNIPEDKEEPEQTSLEQQEEYKPPVTLQSLKDEIKFQREILQSILHIVTDIKTGENQN